MAPPRKRVFGRLFWLTVLLAILSVAYTATLTGWAALRAVSDDAEVRSMVEGLRHPDGRVRLVTVGTLLHRGSAAAVPDLIKAAHDPDGGVRALSCRALTATWADPRVTLPVLTAAADDEWGEVRVEAASGIGQVYETASLAGLLRDAGPGKQLAPETRDRARLALLRLLRDRSARVRAAAAESLGQFGPDPEAAEELAVAAGDVDRGVRLAAATALLTVAGPGDRTAAKTLVAMAADPGPIPDRPNVLQTLMNRAKPDVQEEAVSALGAALAGAEPAVVGDMLDCLARLGPKARAALPALERMMSDPQPEVRSAAAKAVLTIEGADSTRAVSLLLRLVTDPTARPETRMEALEQLFTRRNGPPSPAGPGAPGMGGMVFSVPTGPVPADLAKLTGPLIRQLADPNADVRNSALQLLAPIVAGLPAEVPGVAGPGPEPPKTQDQGP